VAIGAVAQRGAIRIQLTALEVRTTHSVLGWRLWIEGREDLEPVPAIEVSDDLGTAYRAELISGDWGQRDGITLGRGELVVVTPLPAGARAVTFALHRLAVDPDESRFPGAKPTVLAQPVRVAVDLVRMAVEAP
jgi:hypothetical protein